MHSGTNRYIVPNSGANQFFTDMVHGTASRVVLYRTRNVLLTLTFSLRVVRLLLKSYIYVSTCQQFSAPFMIK